jgi:hypothetical protein
LNNYYSGNYAYTELLRNVGDEIIKQFRKFHSKEEATMHLQNFVKYFTNKVNGKPSPKYDSMSDEYKILKSIYCDCVPDFAKEIKDDEGRSVNDKLFPPSFSKEYDSKISFAISEFQKAILKLPSMEELNIKFLEFLYGKYKYFKSSSDYITRLVKARLSDISEDLFDINASTGLLIMKQFIKQFGCGTITLSNGKEKHIEDRDKGKNEKNANSYYSGTIEKLCNEKYGGDYETMASKLTEDDYNKFVESDDCNFAKIADNFSKGYFNSMGKTREYIYIFAIAFEMNGPQNIINEKNDNGIKDWTDINQCLFFDFYTDNLINQTFGKINNAKDEKDKNNENFNDGYGINWKNFVEIIYLYYLNRSDMSAKEKLYGALKGYYYCHTNKNANTFADLQNKRQNLPPESTEYYRKNFLQDLMNIEDEKKFLNKVILSYECKKPQGNTLPLTEYTSVHRTALDFFNSMGEKMKNNVPDNINASALEFWDVPIGSNKIIYNGCNICYNNISFVVNQDFIDCINRFNDRYIIGSDSINYNGDIVICRTDLISRFSDYLVDNFYNNPDCPVIDNFSEFFKYFCNNAPLDDNQNAQYYGINSILIKCGYQEINTKNIFDILIIFITFRKIYTLFY